MIEALGFDCDGKPLRAGDDVVVVDGCGEFSGRRTRVVRACNVLAGRVEVEIPQPDGQWRSVRPHLLKKISGPGLSSWDEVSKATGWKPRVEAPARTEEVGL